MVKLFSFLFKKSSILSRLKELEGRVFALEHASGRRRKYLDRLDKSLRAEEGFGGH